MEHNANRPGAAAPSTADCGLVDERDSNLTASPKPDRGVISGRKFGHWTAVEADATGKRVHCQCVCGRIRYLGIDELKAGAASSCGCQPPTDHEHLVQRAEQARRKAVSS